MQGEHRIGFGFLTVMFAGYGLSKYHKNIWIRILILSALTVFLLALVYPFEITPWRLIWEVFPAAGAIRVVARISLLLLIPVAIGVALGLESIKKPSFIIIVLVLLCVEQLTLTPKYDKHKIRSDVKTIADQINPNANSFGSSRKCVSEVAK
jgi:membrane protein YdbS with pleckstrin-like domain